MATYNFGLTSVSVPFIAAFADKLPILLNSNKQFDKEFRAGTGTSIDILIPDHPDVQIGAAISSSDYTSGSVSLTLVQRNVSIDANQVVRAFNIHDFTGQVAKPYGKKLASDIQTIAADEVKLNADTQSVLGTANFAGLGAAVAGIRKARSYGELYGALDPVLSATINASGAGLFLPSTIQGPMFMDSKLGRYQTAEFFESPDVTPLVTGTATIDGDTDVAVTVNGSTTINIDGITGATGTVKKGQGFTIAGINAVDIYGNDIGKPYVFVAQEDADVASNEVSLTVKPIYFSGPMKNVSKATVADGLAVTQLQAANSSYLCGIIWDKMAFAFGAAPLAPISNTDSKMINDGGLPVTTTRGADIANGKEIVRWDTLTGFKMIRSNWASVVWFKVV